MIAAAVLGFALLYVVLPFSDRKVMRRQVLRLVLFFGALQFRGYVFNLKNRARWSFSITFRENISPTYFLQLL